MSDEDAKKTTVFATQKAPQTISVPGAWRLLCREVLWMRLFEIPFKQALKRFAVAGFVFGHLMHRVMNGI
jgi:hypothetical protein